MRIPPSNPPSAPERAVAQEARINSLYALRERANLLRQELYATHELYKQTGDHKVLSRQAQLSVEYERALHQVRKALKRP